MKAIGALALSLLIVFSAKHSAMGSALIKFDAGFPQPGNAKGTIDTQGTITLDPGWIVTSSKIKHRVWVVGGGSTKIYEFDTKAPDNTTWGLATMPSLTSGTEYNVTAEAVVFHSMTRTTDTVTTDPAKSKAK